jgi:hypothetical protein
LLLFRAAPADVEEIRVFGPRFSVDLSALGVPGCEVGAF